MLIGHIFCIYIFSEPVLKISEKLGKDEKDIMHIKLINTQFEINRNDLCGSVLIEKINLDKVTDSVI